MIRRKDCTACINVGVWTQHTWLAWHIKCRRLIDGSKFGQEHSTRHVVVERIAAELDSTCNRTMEIKTALVIKKLQWYTNQSRHGTFGHNV